MRCTALLVLPLALLTACSGSSDQTVDDPVVSAPPASTPAASAAATASAIEGVELLEGDPGRQHR